MYYTYLSSSTLSLIKWHVLNKYHHKQIWWAPAWVEVELLQSRVFNVPKNESVGGILGWTPSRQGEVHHVA